MNKFFIDISTEEKKQEIYNLFDNFSKKGDIFDYYNVCDNTSNTNYLKKIGNEIGFDFSVYQKRKYPKKYCLFCGKELKNGQEKFCCSSCSAKYNNSRRTFKEKKIDVKKTCICCGKEFQTYNHGQKYCSINCFQKSREQKSLNEWKEQPEKYSTIEIPDFIKRYLMKKNDCKCEKCGWGETNMSTNKIPLQVHHINGNCTDNREENLQLLCPNCHSLTDTFGNLNNGNSKRGNRRKK